MLTKNGAKRRFTGPNHEDLSFCGLSVVGDKLVAMHYDGIVVFNSIVT